MIRSRKIALLGRNGQVGWELERTLAPLGEIFATDRLQLDLMNFDKVRAWINTVKPDIIVNAAAYTAVDKAEEEPDIANAINAIIPGILGEEAKKTGSVIIHYSTDYVFNGEKTAPYSETDSTNPINAYGESKLAGELALKESGVPYLIFRTSWVYGLRGRNFLLTMQKLIGERQEIKVVNDQFGAPTWCRLIAEATAQIIAQNNRTLDKMSGVYHLTCGGRTSWFEFAKAIAARQADDRSEQADIQPVSSEQYKTAARRPSLSVLSNEKLQNTFGIRLPEWRDALTLVLRR